MAGDISQALLYPLETGEITIPPGRILLVNLVPDGDSTKWFPANRTLCWSWIKPDAQEWLKRGYEVDPASPPGLFDVIFLALPQQRENALGLIAQAQGMLESGGLLIVGAPNDSGGKRLAGDLEPFCPGLQTLSKQKCRVAWTMRGGMNTFPESWMTQAALRLHPETGMWAQPGLFSWDRVDTATKLLLNFIPEGRTGTFIDAGCGNGVITCGILNRNPAASKVFSYDVDFRAVEACRKNAAAAGSLSAVEIAWQDFTDRPAPEKVDWIIMNPPFHQGKQEAVALGQKFIAASAAQLKPRGHLLLVANVHLPYEKILQAHFAQVEKCHEGQGFKIFRARV